MQAQKEEMLRDDRVILIGEDIATYGGGALFDTFGEKRLWSTPISENAFTGMAVGAAMTGLRPIVDLTIASFMYLASDQIINQAGKLRYMTGGQMQVPAVFRCSMWNGSSVAAQHSDRPYPLFMNAPGLKIIAPSTASDMKGLLKSAIRDDDPVVVFESNALWSTSEQVSTDPDFLVPIGKADIKHPGSDITIVSISHKLIIMRIVNNSRYYFLSSSPTKWCVTTCAIHLITSINFIYSDRTTWAWFSFFHHKFCSFYICF